MYLTASRLTASRSQRSPFPASAATRAFSGGARSCWPGLRPFVAPQPGMYSRWGLGETAPASPWTKLAGGSTAGAASGVMTAIATGSPVAGAVSGGLMAIAPFTGPAAPFLIAAATLVAPLAALMNRGCGQTCIQSSEYADKTQSTVEQLTAAYWAQPVRYRSSQVQTLAYIDQALAWLQQMCSDPALGDAGRRCISERLIRGGSAPWCPTPNHTGCDYLTATRDPIAMDAGVVPDPSPVDTAAAGLLDAAGFNPNQPIGTAGATLKDFLLPAVLIGAGLLAS